MYQLTKKQAQHIVDKMMEDIPYNINIMDESGIIIGSGNKERIGTLHHGAVEAIKQGKIVEIERDEEFVKKGINLPIKMNDEIIGVVGISGEVEETKPFGNLVRSTFMLLIEQSTAMEKENRQEKVKQEFFTRIINHETMYTNELVEQAKIYEIDLYKPSQVVYVEASEWIDEVTTIHVPCFKPSNRSLCLILQESNVINKVIEQIRKQHPNAYISISLMNDKIATGYTEAQSAIRVIKGLLPNKKVIYYENCEFVADISNFLKNNQRLDRLTHLLEKQIDLVKTIQVYISTNLNANEAADMLNIHRNTLNYRLDRIHALTGKNPKNIVELLELLFMLIYRVK
ncbi:CdaR family transcriptional regulator [Bacillus andreraoultii]|uniref:CdaR family transcriptional regulator n=1 Tax=Bacillus andreraoultii TaxID=1499685 RepID=UPI00053A5D17|nr:sugar diacid recognition domain-containing protein [Bacillus andreraoultii]